MKADSSRLWYVMEDQDTEASMKPREWGLELAPFKWYCQKGWLVYQMMCKWTRQKQSFCSTLKGWQF